MRTLPILLVILWDSVSCAAVFPSPGPGTPRYGQSLCSSLPAISATPVEATNADNLATKLTEACGSGAGILELAAGTYTDVNLQLGTGGVTIAGECEIRADNPASKPLLRAGVDVDRSVIRINDVDHRIRITNLSLDGRRSSQTEAGMTSVCADTAPADGVCDSGVQSFTSRGGIDSRRVLAGENSTCVYGVDVIETVWDAIFMRNQENSFVEGSTVDGAGCDSVTCPAMTLPSDNTLESVLLVARGVNFVDSSYVSASGNTVENVTKQGLQCYGSDNCYLMNNTVNIAGITGITFLSSSGAAYGNTISDVGNEWAQNSTTTFNGQGFLTTDGGFAPDFRVAIRDNTVSNTWGGGIVSALVPGTPPEPEIIIERNSVSGSCLGSTDPDLAGIMAGDNVDPQVFRLADNSVTGSVCPDAVLVRNATYVASGTVVSGTVLGGGVRYVDSVITESNLTVDEDIEIDAGSSGTLSGCTLNGGAAVIDASSGAVVRSLGC